VWWADDYHIVNATFLTDTARIEPTGVSGVTTVHVKHPKAPETVDIVVMVSAFETFAFDSNSKTIKKGAIAFVPLRVPPATEKTRVEYSSANPAVSAVTGSNAVAMIAGISDGYTAVTATLKAGTTVIAVAEMAVIVSPVAENQVRITTKSTVLNMEIGSSLTVEAALQGAGIGPTDGYDITWKTSDSAIVGILATEQNITKGNAAYITAKSAGEAVLTLAHQKSDSGLEIWVLIPQRNEVSITLDRTYLELYKDEGAVAVTAALVNGSSADYAAITWTAPKVGGQVIVSVSKATGKTCNIVPRNVGNTASVTGVKLGSGMLNGFFVGATGGTTTRIQVYVEYTYEFELKTTGVITKEPMAGSTVTIPFRVFPTDIEITAQVSDPGKLEVKSVSLNTLTEEGNVGLGPWGKRTALRFWYTPINSHQTLAIPNIK
jgi:hypothetical protein